MAEWLCSGLQIRPRRFDSDLSLQNLGEMIKMVYNIGIIGKGFVGSAVSHGFSTSVGYNANIRIYDKDDSKSTNSLDEVVFESDFIFISVPTPSNKDGSISLKILEDCLKEINSTLNSKKVISDAIFLIRSTVVPGTTENFQKKFKNLKLVFNPEFLTERSANFDFISQPRFILGGTSKNTSKVEKLFRHRFGFSTPIIKTDFKTAELVKYVCNTYFATKISFLNEMKLISDKVGAKWEDIIEALIRDGRVGNSHMNVPGPDGKKGFGGSCFPKDVMALIKFAEKLEIDPTTLKGVWSTNLKVRPEKDWENLLGRAIVESNN